ncbi:MAG: ornithine carbamoyltransferase [Burkholderiales bacterium]|nr:ornithine carbamoyltransferase [Burkholderiales bacterium]
MSTIKRSAGPSQASSAPSGGSVLHKVKSGGALPLRHYLQFSDLNAKEYAYLFERAALIKKKFKAYEKHQPLVDRTLAMIFEKASTRTRVSFEAGMYQLGGSVVNLTTGDSQLGRAEPIEDSAKVISRMVDIVMIRTFEQTKIERFAEHSRVPVINGLTNEFHPCQILADIFTYIEHRGSIAGKTVAWVGDGACNMGNSWVLAGASAGMHVVIGAPDGFSPDADVVAKAREIAQDTGGSIELTSDPVEAATGAEVVVTDSWVSMGREEESADRLRIFPPYGVTEELLAHADPEAIVMHCLPAYRGKEIANSVIEGPQSVVWDEAENRRHAQKAVLAWLLEHP